MFREKTRLYKVYHIHEKGNKDIHQGYVGITRRSLSYRLGQHMCSKRPVGTILRSLGKDNVEIEQLAFLPKEEALTMEYNLRPERNIGWNTLAGGNRKTVRCPKCGKYLPKRKTGTYCAECMPTKFSKGHIPHNYGKGKRFKLISPMGEICFPTSLTQFCKKYNICEANIRKVANGERKHCKGWKAEYIS